MLGDTKLKDDIDNLIEFIIKKHDEYINFNDFNQIKQLIDQTITQSNRTANNILSWLRKNQDTKQYIWLFGLFYYHHIGVEDDDRKAFKLFLKAAKDNYPIAQTYIDKCYLDVYGIETNHVFAFKYYEKSAENGSVIGQYHLGYLYENGIGIEKDLEK